MAKTLLIDPFSGASGDMLLASLVDAGCPLETLREKLLSIPALSGVAIDAKTVKRGSFSAVQMVIDLPEEHAHRGIDAVKEIIDAAPSISASAKERAVDTFTRLAEAEARVHGVAVNDVHFHEVGALDAIVDVVGFYVALEALEIQSLRYTRLVVGPGEVHSQHGEIPLPAPATLELLKGHRTEFSDRREELITPTAASIIATGFEPLPRDRGFSADVIGYGAGTREAPAGSLPNVLRACIGRLDEALREVSIIRTTIDDMNPELYGYIMERLFADGALEVYYHPVMMKKNRPGVEITVITEIEEEQRVAALLFTHSTTLGVRVSHESRVELDRRVETVRTEIGDARVKIGVLPGGGERMSPEYESCRLLADKSGLPIVEVFDIVRRSWHGRRHNGAKDRNGENRE